MSKPVIRIYKDGQLLHANRGPFYFESFGEPTGMFGKTPCFGSVAITGRNGQRTVVSGGVTVCVRFDGRRHWFGIGSAMQVAAANVARLQEA